MEVSDQLHEPAALPLVNEPTVSISRLDGPQRRSERSGKEKNIPAPGGNRTPVVRPVA
jgi:hypothetical protein